MCQVLSSTAFESSNRHLMTDNLSQQFNNDAWVRMVLPREFAILGIFSLNVINPTFLSHQAGGSQNKGVISLLPFHVSQTEDLVFMQ